MKVALAGSLALASAVPVRHAAAIHPTDNLQDPAAKPMPKPMPSIVRPRTGGDARQVPFPSNGGPDPSDSDDPANATGSAGTGFFVAGDGTLLTAAHVVRGCRRTQIISQFVPRGWASLVAVDAANDIAVLRAIDTRPPAIVSVSGSPPVSTKLFVLGYPRETSLTVAAETWAVVENEKFPASVGPLANPREMLWMSAPAVTHGYSGGPLFDPKSGSVVGMVKGTVDGGYLRLIRDLPTTGIAIGPGVSHLVALVRREAPFASVTLASSGGEDGLDTLRRATVHVLCWQ